jgi:hypothetical protein
MDARIGMAKPLVMAARGICVPREKRCDGKRWDECEEMESCVVSPSCVKGGEVWCLRQDLGSYLGVV